MAATSTSTTITQLSAMENPSITLTAPGSASVQDRPIPTLDSYPDSVVLRPSYIGVCGSDVHFWTHGGVGNKLVQNTGPLVMGHEASGVVHSVGSAVTTLKVGDRVAIEPGRPCRSCVRCKDGYYNLCTDMKFAACPPLKPDEKEGTPGCLSKFYRIPADFCYKILDRVGLDEAVLVEPLAVAVHGVRLIDVKPGQSVVVFGAGTIGLCAAAVARVYGASKIVIVDIVDRRLEFAKEFVPKGLAGEYLGTYKTDVQQSPEENARRITEENGLGLGADAVIEATGVESSINAAVHVLRMGGSMVQTGLGKPVIQFPIVEMGEKELHIHGSFRYKEGDFATAMQILESGAINVKKLISEVFPFEEATKAWDATKAGKGIKNMIKGVPA